MRIVGVMVVMVRLARVKGKFDIPQKVETDIIFTRLSMVRTYVCGVEKLTNDIYSWGKGTKGSASTINFDSSTPVKV